MKQFFITGTDTGIGKTVISAVITSCLRAHYWKPIQSRLPDELSDPLCVQQLTGLPDTHFFPSHYEFLYPLSPNHAAEKSGVVIDLKQCQLPQTNHALVVEGAGGVFVPLNERECLMDLMQMIQFPVIIVCRGTLGTINHTLLTIEALQRRNIPIAGLVFNGELNPMSQQTIEQWSGVRTLFHLPYFNELNKKTLIDWLANEGNTLYDYFTA